MKKIMYLIVLVFFSNLVYAEETATSVPAPAEKAAAPAPAEQAATATPVPAEKATEVAPATEPASAPAAASTEQAPVEKAAAPAPAEQAALAKTGVRKPKGKVGKFWDQFDWEELSAEEQQLWGVLGWNAKLWASDTEVPVSETLSWKKLSKEQKAAATALGYSKKSWNKD